MFDKKLSTVMRSLVAAGALIGLSTFSSYAQAYSLKTVFKTDHFAVNQVILDQGETFDAATKSSITGDVQTKNRVEKVSQSSTVIFPEGSTGLTGKIKTPILGVLTIANFDTGKDRIYLNTKLKYSTDAGIYISYKQLKDMINQKALQEYLPELRKIPVVFTEVPVSAVGVDPTMNGLHIVSTSDAYIMDLRIDDSVFYDKATRATLRKGCTVNVLTFIDRMLSDNIPLYIAGRAALNYMDCSRAPAQQQPQK